MRLYAASLRLLTCMPKATPTNAPAECLRLTSCPTGELGHYRRYGDPRYYKGVEYADVLESLARRRIAELFATKAAPANKLYVNVQPLSRRGQHGDPVSVAGTR